MESQPPRPPILDLAIELGISRMASMVGDRDETPYRPRICVLVDHSSGMILHFELSQPDDSEPSLITRALNQLGQRLGGFPRQIFTRSPSIATQFKGPLQQMGVDVVVRESLPMVDQAMASLHDGPLGGGKREQGLMTVPGMTLDHVIAFAEAGKLFYEAAPWQQLWDDDLIEIESPAGPKGTRFAQVLGAAGKTMGLGFVATRAAHENLQNGGGLAKGVGHWNLLFNALDELPFEDGELWEHHNLPVANELAYPSLARFTASTGMHQPGTADLVWAEGLLRALAASTEADFDSGRWEKQVQTIKGPAVYRFSMPILLEQMNAGNSPAPAMVESPQVMMERMLRGMQQEVARLGRTPTEKDLARITDQINSGKLTPAFVPTVPAEKAQELCYRARSARGRRIVQLAKEALEVDPNCCDALVILAEQLSADQSKVPLLEKAVEAGERQLGQQFFKKNTGHFWGLTETRPYMRALAALALELLDSGEADAGILHLQRLLVLNPSDNQGNRYLLAQALLSTDRLHDLDALLNRSEYKDEFSPEWKYTKALLAYRREGDSPVARQHLQQAVAQNPVVARILAGVRPGTESYAPDQVREAVEVAEMLGSSWDEADGATEWLKSQTRATVSRPVASRKKPKKKKR